jgi:hypothetical protein
MAGSAAFSRTRYKRNSEIQKAPLLPGTPENLSISLSGGRNLPNNGYTYSISPNFWGLPTSEGNRTFAANPK